MYGKQDTSWLASWGPVQPGAAPSTAKFVVVGMVEQAGTGASAAAPMSRTIWDGLLGATGALGAAPAPGRRATLPAAAWSGRPRQ